MKTDPTITAFMQRHFPGGGPIRHEAMAQELVQLQAAGRAEPLEVLRDVVCTLDEDRLPYNDEVAARVEALLADVPEPTVDCQMCGGRGRLVSPGFAYTCEHCGGRGCSPGTGHAADAPAPERPEPAADSMHLGGADYVTARARSFEGLQADRAARRDRFSFYLGHDEGFNLGLSVASVNKLVAAHEPHLEALRDATAAVRDRVNEPTAMQVAEAVRETYAKLYCDACYLHDVPTFDDKHNRWMHRDTPCGGNRMRVKPLVPILTRLGVEPDAAGGSTGG